MSLKLQAAMEELEFVRFEILNLEDPELMGTPVGTEEYQVDVIKLQYRLTIMKTGAAMLENIIDHEIGKISMGEIMKQLE